MLHLKATSHTSQELWPWYCESPKRKCPKAMVPTHPQNHVVWSRTLKCSVKPYVIGPSTKCYFKCNFYSCGSSHMINVSIQSVMISRFGVRPTFKRWFLKIIQVTMKHNPLTFWLGRWLLMVIWWVSWGVVVWWMGCYWWVATLWRFCWSWSYGVTS